MKDNNDRKLIEDFHRKSGHSAGSIKSYQTVFNKYRKFHSMSLSELLDEAIFEQERQIPNNRLSIHDRLLDFRAFLIENHRGNTPVSSMSKIKTFYRYNRVAIPFLPPLNSKSLKLNEPICFEDLPTKDELRLALEYAPDDLKLWIMTIVSSGSSRADAKSMTNRTFFEGTLSYHRKDSFRDALEYLAKRDDVVCTCKLIRQKTGKPYYAFLNPECVQMIAQHKLEHEDFDLESPLLKYDINYLSDKFKILNDSLGFGKAGGYSRLRPHMLRKFNSTYLNQGTLEDISLNMDDVDAFHGRGKNKTRQSYFKDNPEYLKLKYVKAMNNISLYHKYDYGIVNGKIIIFSMEL